jgi:hypothetical protein
MLRLASSVWRGPALADFRYEPFAQAEIARLELLRLVSLEERIEADLALGAGSGLIGEPQHLVASEPLRERPRGQLMRALYRAGRQVEALDAYRELGTLLRDELGLDPAPALRELEAAILRHDPALHAVQASEVTVEMPVRKHVTVLCAELRAASTSGAGLDPEALDRVLANALAIIGSTHSSRPRRPRWSASAGWRSGSASAWRPARRWSAVRIRPGSPAVPSPMPSSWRSGQERARSGSASRPARWLPGRWRWSPPEPAGSGC